mgnify:FL=1
MINFAGHCFEKDFILLNLRWYAAYKLSYRNLVEMATERGVSIAHTTIMRWVLKFSTEIDKAAIKLKKPTGNRYFLDETYIKVKGVWKYLYRAVDEAGQTVDYLLTSKRDKKAAARFFKKAIGSNPQPEKIYIDKSGPNKAGIEDVQRNLENPIIIDQSKYMNNRIEQDHRQIKQLYRATLGFKGFWSAWQTLRLFEVWQMFKKNQIEAGAKTPVGNFYALFS